MIPNLLWSKHFAVTQRVQQHVPTSNFSHASSSYHMCRHQRRFIIPCFLSEFISFFTL